VDSEEELKLKNDTDRRKDFRVTGNQKLIFKGIDL